MQQGVGKNIWILFIVSILLFVLSLSALNRVRIQSLNTVLLVTGAAPHIDSVKLCLSTGNPSGCAHVPDVVLTGGTTTLYSIAGVITDPDGMSDISQINATYSRTGIGACTIADVNNCYIRSLQNATCTLTTLSSTQGAFECAIELEHYADATDDGANMNEGAFPAENWEVRVYVEDLGTESDTSSVLNEVNSLRDISVCNTVDYGALMIGTASTTGVNCLLTNDGNVDVDIEINATAMSCTIGSVPSANQRIDIVNASYAGMGISGTYQNYTASPASYTHAVLNKRIDSTLVTDDLYHTISVPFGVRGTCAGVNTISAITEL